MTQRVTYVRDADRTRIVIVLEGCTPEQARQRASELVPDRGFRFAAQCEGDGRLRVPMDGDDYGADPAPPQTAAWSRDFAQVMARAA
jgi:hypothetical protein